MAAATDRAIAEGPAAAAVTQMAAATDQAIAEGPAAAAVEGKQRTHSWGKMILSAPIRFVLTQDDQKVVLTEPDGRMRTLPTNNRKVKVDGRDVRTKWEKDRLVSEITVGNAKVIETYERSPNASQLIVTARVDMRGRQVSVRRVYDAVTK